LGVDWSQTFGTQEVILQYLENVSRKYMIKHTCFEIKVTSVVWIREIKKMEVRV
jgi:hypothetical protein